jgi:hypothetical protein
MEHEHTLSHHRHELVVKITPVDGRFEASIEEPGVDVPHYVMSGPPKEYREVVEEIIDALREHLLRPGE